MVLVGGGNDPEIRPGAVLIPCDLVNSMPESGTSVSAEPAVYAQIPHPSRRG